LIGIITSLKLLNKFGDINNLSGEMISSIFNLYCLITRVRSGSFEITEEEINRFMDDIKKIISIMSNPAPFIDSNRGKTYGINCEKYLI
jgi:hypothetical protein